MPESVLTILKLVFLAALYLFLARVVRAVWVEIFAERRTALEAADAKSPTASHASPAPVDPPKAAKGRKERKAEKKLAAQAYILRVVEPPDQRGQNYNVQDEMTLGRAAGCAIVIQDTFASQLHARIFRRDGLIFVEDLGSTNGTFLNRQRVHGPVQIETRDRVQVGNVVLELHK
jgi:hypothetical protein